MTRLFPILTIMMLLLVDVFAYSSDMAYASYFSLSIVFAIYIFGGQLIKPNKASATGSEEMV